MERFYEFYTRVICLKYDVNPEDINKTWHLVENQSERQFGAYLFTYLLDHKTEIPLTIDDTKPDISGVSRVKTKTWKSFRNAVVHKGYIPSNDEALAYVNLVYCHVNDLIQDLKSRNSKYINQEYCLHISRATKAANGQNVSTMSIPTLITLGGRVTPISLKEAMKDIEKYRQWLFTTEKEYEAGSAEFI